MCLDNFLDDLVDRFDCRLPKGIDSSARNFTEVNGTTDGVGYILGATKPLVRLEQRPISKTRLIKYSGEMCETTNPSRRMIPFRFCKRDATELLILERV